MICPHCGKSVRIDDIKRKRGKGFNAEFQCYHCEAWLGRSACLSRVKMSSFYFAIAASIWSFLHPPMRHIATPIAIIAIIVMLVAHMMDQLRVISVPEKPDDSDQRQKYR